MMIPTILAIGVISNPDAPIRVLSYIPMFTPQLMMLRIVTKIPPAGEIIGTLVVMVVIATVVLTWACSAKIFAQRFSLWVHRRCAKLCWLREA